jgi:hypothetical protein
MNRFQRFVGIDWSGAKGVAQSGIQVAELEVDSPSPRLRCAPNGRKWSRYDVMEYIGQLNDKSTLVGIDFAFSVPWNKSSQFAPHVNDARTLWALVDSLCDGAPHLYAGPVWTAADSPFRPYIFHYQTKYRGERYDRKRRREVEKLEGNAISVYHMAGPQVGAGSFSGMRLLHQITKSHGETIAIWPFDKVDGNKTAVVEIYPSFFYRKAGARRPNSKDLMESNHTEIEKALKYYGATRVAEDVCRTVDQADALIAAAALRKLSTDLAFETPARPNFDLREGWIFGLPPDGNLLSAG